MKWRPVLDRLIEKVTVTDTDCWDWTAGRDKDGYARLKVEGRAALAHRVAYELLVAAIPSDCELDHTCRNRSCVNPAHLEPVSHSVNVLRGESPAAKHAAKTHCIRGHDLARAHIDPKGRRVCGDCIRERQSA